MQTDVYILGGARTPMGEYNGKLKDLSAIDLGAIAAGAAMERTNVAPAAVDHVIFGNVLQTSADAVYGARHVGLKAGVPIEVPALTVNRLCGSGIQAAISGGQMIRLGEADVVLTGGMESMSQAPHVIRGLRNGLRLGQGQLEDTLWSALLDTHCGCTMAATAENCAAKYGVSRQEQDEFGARSQNLAEKAIANGFFDREITPVTTPDGTVVSRDDGPRPGVTVEGMAGLKPVFRPDGTVTAGNACPLNDGAAAVVIMSDTKARELGLTPLARIVSTGVSGLSPEIMGLGPIEASKQALARAGMSIGDIDLAEINEAFAAQVIPSYKELGIDIDRLNVNGGAIALGHPFGMTGARITGTLLNSLDWHDKSIGLETMCVGGGQGMAMILERLS